MRRALATLLLTGPAALAGVLTPSASAADAPVLRWEVSQQFDDHLSDHQLGDGATEDSGGVVTFPQGVGTYDPDTGVSRVEYQGWVRGAFSLGQEFYHVRIEDPTLVVDGSGRGEMTALVSAANIAAQGNEAEETSPVRVVMFGFDAGSADWAPDGSLAVLSATPDWAGVLEPGSAEAAELGIEEGDPREGKSWAPAFLRQITSGVRAHFHATGASSDEKKAPAPFLAQAVPTGVVPEPPVRAPLDLTWAVSQEFTDTFDRTLADGATEAAGVVTFPRGEGSYDEATGVTSVAYAGSVTGSVSDPLLGLVTEYAVTLADPVLSVDGSGAGVLTALVSGETPSLLAPLLPGTSTSPTRVAVATFAPTDADWTPGDGVATLSVTPDWLSRGRSFPSAFIDQLTAESRDHFRAVSSDAAEDAKAPAALTATTVLVPAPEPETGPEPEPCLPAAAEPAVRVERLDTTSGDTFRITGTGFRAQSCSGDAGVYVGIAPGTVLPDVSRRENTDQFTAVDWVSPGRISGGGFSSTLTVADGVPPGATYSVFTWQAHTHSNTSQDTVTPLPGRDPEPATTTTEVALRDPVSRGRGVLVVTVASPTSTPSGSVSVVVSRAGDARRYRAELEDGVATVRFRVGTGRVTVRAAYAGSEEHTGSTDRLRFRVR